MILAYVGLALICFLATQLYRGRVGRLVCIASGFFLTLSIIHGLNPQFNPEEAYSTVNPIPIYWSINFGLFLCLLGLKANKALCSICFAGLIAHALGHLSYLFYNYQLLMMYNQGIVFLNLLYVLFLLGLSDARLDLVDRSTNLFRSLYRNRNSL